MLIHLENIYLEDKLYKEKQKSTCDKSNKLIDFFYPFLRSLSKPFSYFIGIRISVEYSVSCLSFTVVLII